MAESFQARTETELRRGVLQVAVLAQLRRRTYGYDLLRLLSELGLPTEEGTLYPVLRRLEQEGLLASSWDTSGSRPRKYYESTDEGRAALATLLEAWDRVDRALRSACAESDENLTPSVRPPPTQPVLREYLGRVRSHLPVGASSDILRELESSILDRADEMAADRGAAVDDAVLRATLAEVGEPETVAASYAPQAHLVAPEHYRAFLVWTALVFAVHLVLVGVATATERALHFGPVGVSPVGPHGIVSLAAASLHALLVDVGLTVVVFGSIPWLGRFLRLRSQSFGVDAAPRTAGGRAVLAVLVGCVLGIFRDRVFVVMDGPDAHPLFTPWFAAAMPLVLGLLAAAVVADVLYLVFGERRSTLAVDALHGAATLAVMVHMARGDALLQVPPVAAFADFRGPVNGFLENLGTLVLVVLAAIAAVKTVRRLVRVAQI